jgi:hypothetical protein
MNGTSLPSPTGKHKVGRMSIQLTDQNRLEAYSTEKKDKRRELVAWIWYPSAPHPILNVLFTYLANGLQQTLFTV